jgi:hypothetical protein
MGAVPGKQHLGVRLNKHTLKIGKQVYQLRNLARVQLAKAKYRGHWYAHRAVWQGAAGLVLLLFLNALLHNAQAGLLSQTLRVLNLPALFAIILVTIVRVARDSIRRPRYVLLLETTGRPVGALTSTNREQLERLADAIADALENPPQSPQEFRIDLVRGDKIEMYGQDNIGKLVTALDT